MVRVPMFLLPGHNLYMHLLPHRFLIRCSSSTHFLLFHFWCLRSLTSSINLGGRWKWVVRITTSYLGNRTTGKQVAGWAPGLVETVQRRENLLPLPENESWLRLPSIRNPQSRCDLMMPGHACVWRSNSHLQRSGQDLHLTFKRILSASGDSLSHSKEFRTNSLAAKRIVR
jgi:hypothetical protein